MGISEKWGSLHLPQNNIVRIIETPKKGTPIFGQPTYEVGSIPRVLRTRVRQSYGGET